MSSMKRKHSPEEETRHSNEPEHKRSRSHQRTPSNATNHEQESIIVDNLSVDYPTTQAEGLEVPEPVTPVKRGRGRPRIHPIAPPVEIDPLTPKRGRGRPRKDPSAVILNGTIPKSTPGVRGRPRKDPSAVILNGTISKSNTPGKRSFSTPIKNHDASGAQSLKHNANRSARRKSARSLIERTILGNTSDNDDEDDLALQIYDSEQEDEMANEDNEDGFEATPVKTADTPRRGAGRPKGSRNKERSPTPEGLPPHELYFAQNRGGRPKTSNNTLASLALLDHEEFFSLMRKYNEPHADDIAFLEKLHATSFNQWLFELSEGFSLCLYGWGSKRSLLLKFAEHVHNTREENEKNKIVIVNGYVQALNLRDVMNVVASAISTNPPKLGSQPAEMLHNVIALLEQDPSRVITLIIHSIDRAPLRRPQSQMILSRLGAHSQIHLVVSADHPSFPLMWDSSLRATYNFLFHDCTTFEAYGAEIDVVEEVHELLGRSGRRVGGREGVGFVLKSLPENAKNLFRVLVAEQLVAMDSGSGGGFADVNDDDDNEDGFHTTRDSLPGVEYRILYQKAVEEFICSSEMNFRTLLKEFHDHQMIQSRKDALGTEILSIPFRKEELETILEDLMG